MPGPVSAISTRSAVAPSAARAGGRCAPAAQYLTALSSRLVNTCSTARRSARAGGRSPADLVADVQLLLLDARAQQRQRLIGDDAQRHRLRLGTVVLGFDARQIEQVLDQRAEALGVSVDDVDEAFGRRPDRRASVSRRVSTAERTAVIGVRSSCDTLATKSLRSVSSRRVSRHVDEHGEQPLVLAVRPWAAAPRGPAAGAAGARWSRSRR